MAGGANAFVKTKSIPLVSAYSRGQGEKDREIRFSSLLLESRMPNCPRLELQSCCSWVYGAFACIEVGGLAQSTTLYLRQECFSKTHLAELFPSLTCCLRQTGTTRKTLLAKFFRGGEVHDGGFALLLGSLHS
jgi:hypothetical protein